MSSRKFSYWSSPQTSTKSGLKSSRILRIARKSLPKRSPQRWAAERPSSLPSSARSSEGQLAGSFLAGSTLGASSTRLNTSVRRSFGRHKVGQWVQPSPRISAISFLPLSSFYSCRSLESGSPAPQFQRLRLFHVRRAYQAKLYCGRIRRRNGIGRFRRAGGEEKGWNA